MKHLISLAAILLATGAGSPAVCAQATAAAEPASRDQASMASWLEATASSVVRVRVVLEATYSMGGQTEKQEFTSEVLAVVVDPGGLLLLSNSHVSVSRAKEVMSAMGGGQGADLGWNVTPLSFHVVSRDGSEMSAALVAMDSDLDLAFLQLESPPPTPLPAVRFVAGELSVGDEVRLLGRLGGGFDHAPWIAWGRIAGAIQTPRRAWIVDASDGSLGLPVFDRAGSAIGVLTTLFARGGAGAEEMGLAAMMSRFGGQGSEGGPVGTFILPGDTVTRLVERARVQARSLLEEPAASPSGPATEQPESPDSASADSASSVSDAADH